MRRVKLIGCLAGVALLCALGARAGVQPNASRQLGRGLSNVAAGILEVPYNMHLVNQDLGGFAGLTYGTIRGIGRFVAREVVGVFEVLTFPMGWSPIIEPEFPMLPAKTTTWRVNPEFRKRY